VRLADCPLRCRYCDSESTWTSTPAWRVAAPAGLSERANPASVDDALAAVAAVEAGEAPRPVSITGGEPLVHAEFVKALAVALRAQGRRVHLETAGVHARELERVLPNLDHVSADFKLGSTMEVGDFREAHRRFLEACARARVDACVKCVVTPSVADAELDEAVAIVAAIDPATLFIVQPVTPMRRETAPIDAARVDALVARARAKLRNVRVIPQVHRAMGRP